MSIIPHRSRGIRRIFTLIELLITIAIIAILLTSGGFSSFAGGL